MSDTDNLVTAAADLGRRTATDAVNITSPDHYNPLVINRLRDDEHVDVQSLERHLAGPLTARGTANLHDPSDFTAYINRLRDVDATTVWADVDKGQITAVFDDHIDYSAPGWRSHTAVLSLKADPDWSTWLLHDGKPGDQAWFGEHLEDLAHTVVDPDAATMLEIARSFDAKRSVKFKSGVRIDTGDVQLTFEETTQAKAGQSGQMEIPAGFILRISPFLGVDPAEVTARLRYRIVEGRLTIGYALLRPDRVRRDIVAALVGQIAGQIDPVKVFLGTPPPPVQPR